MTPSPDRTVLGATIAAALTLFAITARRRQRALGTAALARHDGRGRNAEEPQDMPAAGWRDALRRLMVDFGRANLSLMAAGIAFYALLSFTPGLTALVAIYGLAFDPGQVQAQVASLEGMIPEEARTLIADQLNAIVQASSSKLSMGLVISLTLALWSANSGTSALMQALNVVYGEQEKRNVLRYYANALALTSGLVIFGILSLLLVAVAPAVLGLLPLGHYGRTLIEWSRWPLLMVLSSTALAIIYRYAPSRTEPRWSWASPGAAAATVLWLGASALFSVYVQDFASYNKTYGSLGAVVVLLLWLWLSSLAALLGAELNAELEHQTARDTTRRPRKPMGKRGAYVADTVAPNS
jgi:membrane protein